MFDIKGYFEKNTQGLCTLVKASDSYALSTKRFDPETGAGLPDEVIQIRMQELLDRKIALNSEIADIDAFIADTKAL